METAVSIDNLTIVVHDTPLFKKYLAETEPIHFIGSSKNYAYRYAYQCITDGTYIEHAENGKVRIEFNPNKANMEIVKELLSTVRYPYLTRMDIAVDYFGRDLSQMEWTSKTAVKETTIKKRGKLETLYLGARSSDRMYRIYNKALEREENDGIQDTRASEGHWRVEVQQRYTERETAVYDVEDYFQNFFSDISPHASAESLDLSFIESVSDKIMVKGLLHDTTLFNELSSRSKVKYRKLLEEARAKVPILDIIPEEAYKKEKSRLACQLSELLKNTLSYVQV